MDNKTTISEMKERVKRFCEERDWDQFHNPKDLAIGLVEEAVEVLEKFRFKSEIECENIMNDPSKRKDVSEELSDVMFQVMRISQKYNIDISSAYEEKMKKNELKYPIEKCKGKNHKYTELK